MSHEPPNDPKPILGGVLSPSGSKGVLSPGVGSGLQISHPEPAKGLTREDEADRDMQDSAVEGALARPTVKRVLQGKEAAGALVDVRRLERDVRALEREVAELKRMITGVSRLGV